MVKYKKWKERETGRWKRKEAQEEEEEEEVRRTEVEGEERGDRGVWRGESEGG